MKLKNVIGNNSHWIINKKLAKEIGLKSTIFLQHLIDIEDSFFGAGNEFYQQQDRMIEDLPLSERNIRDAQKILVERGFLQITKKGIPAKNWFKLNSQKILDFIFEQQEVAKCDNGQSQNATSKTNNVKTNNKERTQSVGLQFTDTKEQIKFDKADCNISWEKLLSVWQTNEYPNTLKKIKSEYWDKIGQENRNSILQMMDEFSQDKEQLQRIWISDCFKNNKMNSVALRKEIEAQKLKSKPNSPPNYLRVDPDWEY